MSRSRNIRVNKAYHVPEPDYRWRVTIPGMEPVRVIAKTCYEALEQAAPVFGQSFRSMKFRGKCVLVGVAGGGSGPLQPEQRDEWGPRQDPAERSCWGEEAQRNDDAFAAGGNGGYEACADEEAGDGSWPPPEMEDEDWPPPEMKEPQFRRRQ